MSDFIDELFEEGNAVSTHDVAIAFEMSEAEVRSFAEDLGVARIGASFAWARPDVEALAEQLGLDEDDDDEDDNDEDEDDEDES
jgi:hypothetical protein